MVYFSKNFVYKYDSKWFIIPGPSWNGMPNLDGTWGALAGGSEDTSPAFNTGSPTGGEAEEDSPPKQPKAEVEVEQVGTVRTFFPKIPP